MLFSYLHRFDVSRSTKLYFIEVTLSFSIGGIVWVAFMSTPLVFLLPFDFVTELFIFVFTCLFAYRRQELFVVWHGIFHDFEIGN